MSNTIVDIGKKVTHAKFCSNPLKIEGTLGGSKFDFGTYQYRGFFISDFLSYVFGKSSLLTHVSLRSTFVR